MVKKKPKKQPGHYCRRCGRRRANEKFSGKGHSKHICKSCENEKRAELKRTRQVTESKRVATNLFADLPTSLPDELLETILQTRSIRIERIVSTGQASPENFWYDQDEHEWVVLLRGSAVIDFYGEIGKRRLQPGDHVLIPAHQKHRVVSTSTKKPTVWLAVFFKGRVTGAECRIEKPTKTKKKKQLKKPPESSSQQMFDF